MPAFTILPVYTKRSPEKMRTDAVYTFPESLRSLQLRMILRILLNSIALRNDAVSAIIASANARGLITTVVALESLADGVNAGTREAADFGTVSVV